MIWPYIYTGVIFQLMGGPIVLRPPELHPHSPRLIGSSPPVPECACGRCRGSDCTRSIRSCPAACPHLGGNMAKILRWLFVPLRFIEDFQLPVTTDKEYYEQRWLKILYKSMWYEQGYIPLITIDIHDMNKEIRGVKSCGIRLASQPCRNVWGPHEEPHRCWVG